MDAESGDVDKDGLTSDRMRSWIETGFIDTISPLAATRCCHVANDVHRRHTNKQTKRRKSPSRKTSAFASGGLLTENLRTLLKSCICGAPVFVSSSTFTHSQRHPLRIRHWSPSDAIGFQNTRCSAHICKTVLTTEVLLLQVRVCGTVYRRTRDRTSAIRDYWTLAHCDRLLTYLLT